MSDRQYIFIVVCLAVSAVCCIAAAVISYINNRNLSKHMKSIENNAA